MKKLGREKIGLVGVGNMGTSILAGLLKDCMASPSQIWVYDKDPKKAEDFVRKERIHLAASNLRISPVLRMQIKNS